MNGGGSGSRVRQRENRQWGKQKFAWHGKCVDTSCYANALNIEVLPGRQAGKLPGLASSQALTSEICRSRFAFSHVTAGVGTCGTKRSETTGMRALLLLLTAFVGVVGATRGVDVSSAVYVDPWKCLKSNGYSFAIIRCYESIGKPDSNCPHTIYNAWNGGMEHVDVYMFPDPGRGDPAGQVNEMLNYLAQFNIHPNRAPPATYGMVWLDIEGPQYWSSSHTNNQNFFNGLVNALKSAGQHFGVYSSKSQWEPIFGSFTGGSSFPLWYAHYDGNPSFSDFEPFGGWTKPAMKQFRGDASICGVGVDENVY
eukprot:m.6746 g.6746  ORF g.6746 m.6746 type:complete len:310 (+) comp2649_c0_seq2:251-1180(+)